MELRILQKFIHMNIVPTQLGSVICVSLGGKHKDENVQTWGLCFVYTIEIPRPEPFVCALKIEDEACKNKITSLFTRQMQK